MRVCVLVNDGIVLSCEKEGNPPTCDNMDGPRVSYTKSQAEKDSEIALKCAF